MSAVPITARMSPGDELLHRRAYQVGCMRSAVEQALRYLDCGETEWARKRLVEALEVGK